MNRNRVLTLLAVLFTTAILHHTAVAADQAGAVLGIGRTSIKRQPEILRVKVAISADGKDITEAVAHLKDAETAAAKKLADLGAIETSVEFTPPDVGSAATTDPRQQYVQRMVAARGGRHAAPTTQPASVTVSTTLKAEWKLETGTPEAFLARTYALQEKIKGAGLTKKETKALSPEEQEAMEEAAQMQVNNGTATVPGDPVFQYLSHISDDDQATATAEAFQKAKKEAAKLAKAADGELGALRQLSSDVSSPTVAPEDPQQAYYRAMGVKVPSSGEGNATDEAASPTASQVELQVTVTASFDFRRGGQ